MWCFFPLALSSHCCLLYFCQKASAEQVKSNRTATNCVGFLLMMRLSHVIVAVGVVHAEESPANKHREKTNCTNANCLLAPVSLFLLLGHRLYSEDSPHDPQSKAFRPQYAFVWPVDYSWLLSTVAVFLLLQSLCYPLPIPQSLFIFISNYL